MGVNLFGRDRKKGVYFLLDSLIFVTILFSAMFLLQPVPESASIQSRTSYLAKDVIGVLEEMQLYELDNQSWIEAKILDGNISDKNQSVLISIGEFWARNNNYDADTLVNITIGGIVPQYLGHGIWVSGEEIYRSGSAPSGHQTSGWRVISGIEKDKPVKGFVSNARASQVTGNNTQIISISPEGAGWHTGYTNITKYFNLSDVTVSDTLLRLSTHADPSTNDIRVFINGDHCIYNRNDFTWIYSSDGNVGSRSVNGCLVTDMNNITFHLNNNNYNSHTHPGTMLIVNYSSDLPLEIPTTTFSKRYYFDNIVSYERGGDGAGVWAMMPFVIPQNAQNVSVGAQIVGRNVYDFTGNTAIECVYRNNGYCHWHNYYKIRFVDWNNNYRRAQDNDFIVFLNDDEPLFTDGSPSTNPTYTFDQSDLGSNLQNGTNVMAVYFNNYLDMVWGDDFVELYSDPQTNPDGSSFIEVNYTVPISIPYGFVEITEISEFGGSDNRDKTVSFSYPNEAQEKGEFYLHLIQQYSNMVTVWADPFNTPTTQVFSSPSSRAIPTDIYVDPDNFDISAVATNYIRAQDAGSGNDILSISTQERRFYIPATVGFGDVFLTEAQAIADAESRLTLQLGSYLTADSIVSNTNTITKVPTLWGPVIIEARSWE